MDSSFKFGIDVKIWCSLCILANLCSIFLSQHSVIGILTTILFILLLITKGKITFYLLSIMYIVLPLLTGIIVRYPILLLIVSFIKDSITPAITFIILKKYWRYMR